MRRALLFAFLVAGCRAHVAAESAASVRTELDANFARYNRYLGHQWSDSIAAMFAPDGELAAPGRAPIRGPDAIRAFLASFTGIRVDSSAMWSDSVVMTDSGAVQWGRFFQIATPAGRPSITASGGIRARWQRQPDGRWLLRRLETY